MPVQLVAIERSADSLRVERKRKKETKGEKRDTGHSSGMADADKLTARMNLRDRRNCRETQARFDSRAKTMPEPAWFVENSEFSSGSRDIVRSRVAEFGRRINVCLW